jgi:hypothetical protein
MERDTRGLPLGLRADAPLTDEQRRILQSLQDYDLSRVRTRLVHEGALPVAGIDEAIFEFRRYLGVCVVTGASFHVLSRQVDHVWHTSLLFTEVYADFCQQTVGGFLHHEPETPGETPSVGDMPAVGEKFRASYEALFGPLGRLWKDALQETTERDIESLSQKLTAFALMLSHGERGAFDQLLDLAAMGREAQLRAGVA